MNDEIDAALIQRLADLGGGPAGALGGARGAGWAARRLKTETAAEARSFAPGQAPAVLGALSHVLQVQPDPAGTGPGEMVVLRGVVGSGAGGLNPAYVIAVVDTGAGQLSLAAHAKEGLIKQRTAQKAVQRVLAALPDQ